MADLCYYAGKITECLRLLESNNDPLYRNVYQAMANEFAEKYEALKRRALETAAEPPDPPLLVPHRTLPPLPADASGRLMPDDAPGFALARAAFPGRALPSA